MKTAVYLALLSLAALSEGHAPALRLRTPFPFVTLASLVRRHGALQRDPKSIARRLERVPQSTRTDPLRGAGKNKVLLEESGRGR